MARYSAECGSCDEDALPGARATTEAPHILISTRTALNPKAHNEGRRSASSDSNPELIIDFSNDGHGKRDPRTS